MQNDKCSTDEYKWVYRFGLTGIFFFGQPHKPKKSPKCHFDGTCVVDNGNITLAKCSLFVYSVWPYGTMRTICVSILSSWYKRTNTHYTLDGMFASAAAVVVLVAGLFTKKEYQLMTPSHCVCIHMCVVLWTKERQKIKRSANSVT